jgi:hypothetical protein
MLVIASSTIAANGQITPDTGARRVAEALLRYTELRRELFGEPVVLNICNTRIWVDGAQLDSAALAHVGRLVDPPRRETCDQVRGASPPRRAEFYVKSLYLQRTFATITTNVIRGELQYREEMELVSPPTLPTPRWHVDNVRVSAVIRITR